MSLNIITASAGSGKTYTLVMSYLKLILNNPDQFAHILAITFTNKAAVEMKTRIIRRLCELSSNDTDLANMSTDISICLNNELSVQAQKCLEKILHNYSSFAISTIDSFSQRLIRTFAREMKLSSSFEVELEFDKIIEKAINNIINKAGSDQILTEFLINYISNSIENEKNTNITAPLISVAQLLNNEKNRNILESSDFFDLTINDFQNIIRFNHSKIKSLKNEIKKVANDTLTLIFTTGIQIEDFYHGKTGIGSFFLNASNNPDRITVNSYQRKAVEENVWYSKSCNSSTANAIDSISDKLCTAFDKIKLIFNELSELILTTENLYPLALLNEISKEIDLIKKEDDILPIAEFNNLINDVISQSDTPFIYERIGEQYKNFLIDEFQDTSVLQWLNLIPLIDNSLATSDYNLIVGDGKQSIYRWRNGEVRQFIQLPKIFNVPDDLIWRTREKNFIDNYKPANLPNNFRSGKAIVEFNNSLFEYIANLDSIPNDIRRIYANCRQDARKQFNGYVEISLFDKNNQDNSSNEEEYNCDKIIQIITDSVSNYGFNYNDIAILCEKKIHARIIANYLTNKNINVVSPDSLMLSSSSKIMFIVSIIRMMTGKCCDIDMYYFLNFVFNNKIVEEPANQVFYEIIKQRTIDKQLFDTPKDRFFTEIDSFCKNHNIHIDFYKLLHEPVFEICQQIIDTFNLNDTNDIFVQQLLNYVFSESMNINDFPSWFDDNVDKLVVSSPDNIDAVNIMTIHKSKGLEFPIVICPFANYDTKSKKEELILVKSKINYDEVKTIPYIFVKYSKLDSVDSYKEEFDEENEKRKLDIINLLYVAATRPTEQLYIISTKYEKDIFKVPQLMTSFSSRYGNTFGEKETQQSKKKDTEETLRHSPIYINWRDRLEIARSAESRTKYEKNAEYNSEEISRGKQIHYALSFLRKPEDIDVAIKMLKLKYILDEKETHSINKTILTLINNFEISPLLFDYDHVYIERDMTNEDGEIFRVDRLTEKTGKYNVFDFKTGKPNDSNKKQVINYCKIIKKITSSEVAGYLVYCNENDSYISCEYSTHQIGI